MLNENDALNINILLVEYLALFLGSWNVRLCFLYEEDSSIPVLHGSFPLCINNSKENWHWRRFTHLKLDIHNKTLSDWPSRCREHFCNTDIYCHSRCWKVVNDTEATVPTNLCFLGEFSYHRHYCPYRTASAGKIIVPHPSLSQQMCETARTTGISVTTDLHLQGIKLPLTLLSPAII